MNTQKIKRIAAAIVLYAYGQFAIADAVASDSSRQRSDIRARSGMEVSAAESRHFVIYNNFRALFEMPFLRAEGIDDIIGGEVQKAPLSFTTRNLATNFFACSMRMPVTGE